MLVLFNSVLFFDGVNEVSGDKALNNDLVKPYFIEACIIYNDLVEQVNKTEGAYLLLTPNERPYYRVVGNFNHSLIEKLRLYGKRIN